MGWRDFKSETPIHYVQKVHLVEELPLNVQNVLNVQGEALDIFASDVKNNPRLDLLTETELEAFNGWYATCRKPKFEMSHKEATLKSWVLLIESLEIMYRDGRGRYKKI
tara:strand:- start:43 stop:369 length:327 start_codon:yes stop_codon:yes gene_type:complete